ncbi:hypothetical protein BGL57_01550 [Helicobacter pylori]|nr:hypothetical protein BGL57_01550 [Helicobacter pylori]
MALILFFKTLFYGKAFKRLGGVILKPCSPYLLHFLKLPLARVSSILLLIPNFNSFYNFLSNH